MYVNMYPTLDLTRILCGSISGLTSCIAGEYRYPTYEQLLSYELNKIRPEPIQILNR